ncbi:MAG: hypothetical protein CMJ64_21710 [Planctomycetaceae bacterium]|nr:hypothetical protein [Planctomycetaceae bacterium]
MEIATKVVQLIPDIAHFGFETHNLGICLVDGAGRRRRQIQDPLRQTRVLVIQLLQPLCEFRYTLFVNEDVESDNWHDGTFSLRLSWWRLPVSAIRSTEV